MSEKASRKLIAERAGVSTTTVTRMFSGSGYVSESTKNKIIQIAEELGYTPNKAVRNMVTHGNNGFIAVLVPDMTNYYYMEMFDCMTRLLDDTEYAISIYHVTDKNFSRMLDQMLQYRVTAVINMLLEPIPDSYIKKFRCANIKLLHPNLTDDPLQLSFDCSQAIEEAFDKMWSSGCRKFRFFACTDAKYIVDQRIQTYLSVMRKHGFDEPEKTIVWGSYPHVSAVEAGCAVARELFAGGEEADAVFCLNDMMALGAMKIFGTAGKTVGTDILVVGFDNILMGKYSHPSLSTIDSFMAKQAKQYIDYVLTNGEPRPLAIVSEFIERGSTRR